MAKKSKAFGGQLYDRMKGKGLSKSKVYKALTLMKLDEEVRALGEEKGLTEATMLEIAKIDSAPRQKQLGPGAPPASVPKPDRTSLGDRSRSDRRERGNDRIRTARRGQANS